MRAVVAFHSSEFDLSRPDDDRDPNDPPLGQDCAKFILDALASKGVTFDPPEPIQDECGWELYAGLLLAQHNELKDWYRRNFPSEALSGEGYPKSGTGWMWRPEFRTIAEIYETSVDRILRTNSSAKCAEPRKLFMGKK